MERRLSAIMMADMVGYSRLMEQDEADILVRQKAHRSELIDPALAAHQGRVVKTTGDGLLAEFPSVVEAVACAVKVQREMARREADEPQDRRIDYRIGIHVGDVFHEDGDIHGDGVNVAARLEALAESGGICLSGDAHNQLRGVVDVGFEDLSDVQVKNISRPIRAWRVLLDPEHAGKQTSAPKPRQVTKPMIAIAVTVLIALAIGGYRWLLQRPEFTPADTAKMEYTLDEPSIAVLAFDNLTGNEEQENVSDGLSEDIISTLARLPGLVVIARNSSFAYKGQPVDVRKIAEEMSVNYVLEGSLQGFGDNVRVTAQLIDALSGHHVWSRKFDRPRADFFKVRDEITFDIISELNSALLEGDAVWGNRGEFGSIDTWLLGRKVMRHVDRHTRADNQIAMDLSQKILTMDPESAWAHARLSFAHTWNARLKWSEDTEASWRLAETHAEKAIALDDSAPFGYSALAFARYCQGGIDEAISLSNQALERAPGDAFEMAFLGVYLQKDMQVDRSVELFERAARMNRKAPAWVWENHGEALRIAGRYEEAIPIYQEALEKGVSGTILVEVHLGLAVCYDALGRADEAADEIARARKSLPEVSVAFMRNYIPYKDQDYKENWLATLKRLGLPEG